MKTPAKHNVFILFSRLFLKRNKLSIASVAIFCIARIVTWRIHLPIETFPKIRSLLSRSSYKSLRLYTPFQGLLHDLVDSRPALSS